MVNLPGLLIYIRKTLKKSIKYSDKLNINIYAKVPLALDINALHKAGSLRFE